MRMDLSPLLANNKVRVLLIVLAISLFAIVLRDGNPTTLDTNLGIEFIGGVRIPVTLERPVDADTMATMVDTIKLRINKLGLSQAIVRPLGDNAIIVEIPHADERAIANVESILREQGKFEAIIDGVQALNGSDIIVNAVGGPGSEAVTDNPDGSIGWELGFATNRPGAEKFAAAARGKAFFPVFMFIDRPSSAAILLEKSWYNQSGSLSLTERALREAGRKSGDDITILWLDEYSPHSSATLLANVSQVIVDANLSTRRQSVYADLRAKGFTELTENTTRKMRAHPLEDMIASVYVSNRQQSIVNSWKAIGLLSGPTLDPGLASGFTSQFYRITGTATGATREEQQADAVSEIKVLKSVISGGRLPVSTVIGSSYTVSPSLGRQFLAYSGLGLILAISIVALLIIARYRKALLALPIVAINLCEVIITLAFVGTIGTLDLAAAAGIITLIGTGVDDQIIITDEMVRRKKSASGTEQEPERSLKERLGRAFHIVFTVASVAIVTMLPLLFSGIVEITGFAFSYIAGVLVGVLITRPVFGVLVEELFGNRD